MADRVELSVVVPAIGLEIDALTLQPEGELYRVAEIPTSFAADVLGFHDLIRLSPAEDGTFELVRVENAGGWPRFDLLVSSDRAQSDALARCLAQAESLGGRWMREFGGCVAIVVPPGTEWTPDLREFVTE